MRVETLEQRDLLETGRLNLAFLRLLPRYHGSPIEQVLAGETGIIGRLRDMEPSRLARLARCPMALFALPGGKPGPMEVGEPSSVPAGDAMLREFSLVAACFAWHLCQSNPTAASLLLGWPRERCRRVAGDSLANLVQGISRSSPGVRLRMAGHPGFWRDLLECVEQDDGARWQVARVWGPQFTSRSS